VSAAERQRPAIASGPARAGEWPLLLLLFALAAGLSATTILREVNPHDEGLMLQAASRMADGQLPYRDFYWVYGPGQPLILAGLVKLFGPSLLAWRILRVLLDGLVSVLAYAVARRSSSRVLALGAYAAVAAAMAYPALPHPNPALIALGLGGILAARRRPALGGALGGAAVFFHVQLGAAAALGAVLAAAGEGRGRRGAVRAAVAAAATALVLVAPFAIAGGLGRFIDQGLGFALEAPGLVRPPFPLDYGGPADPNKLLRFYFPLLLLLAAAASAVLAVRRRPPLGLLAPAALALGGVAYLLSRPDEYHLIPLAAALPPLLAAQAQIELDAGARVPALAVAAVLALMALHGLDLKRVHATVPHGLVAIPVDVADGVREEPAEARSLGEVVRYVRARVPPGDPVFVANPRHDRIGLGNPLLYVLLDRTNPTRHDGLGLLTEEDVQREVVRDLRRARPRLAIRWLDPGAPRLRRDAPGPSPGATLLDRYLERTFTPVRRFGDYVVLERRGRRQA
jgi:hypothetical protein